MTRACLARETRSPREGISPRKVLARGRVAEVEVEVHQGPIFFKDEEVGDIEAGVGEQIELALHIEIEEAFDGSVRCDDAGVKSGIFSKLLILLPMFVAAAGRGRNRNGKARFGALDSGMEDGVGEEFGAEGGKVLAIVLVEGEIETDALDADLDAFVGIVAEIHFDCENASFEGRFLGESGLVS